MVVCWNFSLLYSKLPLLQLRPNWKGTSEESAGTRGLDIQNKLALTFKLKNKSCVCATFRAVEVFEFDCSLIINALKLMQIAKILEICCASPFWKVVLNLPKSTCDYVWFSIISKRETSLPKQISKTKIFLDISKPIVSRRIKSIYRCC